MDNEIRIGREIFGLANQLKRKIGSESAKYGVTSIQGRIIGFLNWESSKRDIFQRDIEAEFNIRRSSVTSVLKLMEKNGLIERVSVSEDARLKKIILTEKGREVDKHVYNFINGMENELKDEFTDEELDTFMDLVNRLSKKIGD